MPNFQQQIFDNMCIMKHTINTSLVWYFVKYNMLKYLNNKREQQNFLYNSIDKSIIYSINNIYIFEDLCF